MWHFKKHISIAFIIVVCISCSEPEVIIPPLEVPTSGKKVLVEDLTGVRCPNCPSANARLEAIKSIYGDNVIILGVHGNLLTRPLDENIYDFRSPAAMELEASYIPILGKPSAVINRKSHPEFNMLANPLQDQWQIIIERELQLIQRLIIEMALVPNDTGYDLNIGLLPQEDLGDGFRIHCFISENNIVDAQEDVDRIIPDYIHNHVLRAIITPIEGTVIEEPLEEGILINTSISLQSNQIQPFTSIENIDIIIAVTQENGAVEEVNLIHIN